MKKNAGKNLLKEFLHKLEIEKEIPGTAAHDAWSMYSMDVLEETFSPLPDKMIADFYYMNFGFSDITDLDFKIVRADVLVERAMRSLGGAIAYQPIPDSMGAGPLRNFVKLMTNGDRDFIQAAHHLSKARNKVAHSLHEDYSKDLDAFYTAMDIVPAAEYANFQLAMVSVLASISGEEANWAKRKKRYAELD